MTRQQLLRRLGMAVRLVLLVVVAIVVGAPPLLAVRIGSYVLAAGVVEALLLSLGPSAPRRGRSAFDRIAHPRPPEPPPSPESLDRVRREASLAQQTSGGWYFRLRPVLRDVAAVLLTDRHGVDLDRQPQAAHRVLGPEAWERLRPDAAPPDDRWDHGISPGELARVVTRIEEL